MMAVDPLALTNPVAIALVFGPLLGSVLLESRRFRGDSRRRHSDRTYWQLQAWQLAGLILGVLFARTVPQAAFGGPEWLWPLLGCAVGLSGATLRWWAIRTLGAHFTRNLQVTAEQRVVTGGPYRLLRHPSYTGAVLMIAGVGVGLGNALSVAMCLILPAAGYIQRIAGEEKMLHRELGQPYADYANRTKRLIPGLW